MKYEIFGIQFNEINKKSSEVFEELELGDELYYITKETYHHEEEGLTFDYKYVLVCVPCDVYTDEFPEGSYEYQLVLVPMANSLHKEKLESVLDMIGCDLEDIDLTNEYELDRILPDIHSYGLSVNIGDMLVEGEHNIEEVADKTANTIDCINSLRGFYIDKVWNAMGSTGWTTLKCAVKNSPFF